MSLDLLLPLGLLLNFLEIYHLDLSPSCDTMVKIAEKAKILITKFQSLTSAYTLHSTAHPFTGISAWVILRG